MNYNNYDPSVYKPNSDMGNPTVPQQPIYGPNVHVEPQVPGSPNYVDTAPLSPWAYIGYMILFGLPIIGFIMMIVYACGTGNVNRKNFAKAYLILIIIGVILGAVAFLLFGNSIKSISSKYY